MSNVTRLQGPSNSDLLMDTTQYPGFDLPFEGVSGASSIISVADLSNLDGLDRSTDPLSQSANDDHVAAEITVASHQRRDSHDSSDNDFQADSPSMGNSLDDAAADDFGFSGQGKERADGTDLGGRPKDDKADAPPAWSELKTKAGKERKRLPLACIACRRKKIRCSGEKPACKHCLRSRIPCVYKVTTRKAAPRTDYMAMLDKRLKRMEERIIKITPKPDDDQGVGSIPRAVLKPSIPGTAQHGKQGGKKRSADDAFGPDLEAWAKAPSKPTVADDHQKASLQAQEAEETQLFSEGADALPSSQIQEHLAEVFFDNIYGQAYHLLHKPSYMRKLRYGALSRQSHRFRKWYLILWPGVTPYHQSLFCQYAPSPLALPRTRSSIRLRDISCVEKNGLRSPGIFASGGMSGPTSQY